MIKVTPQINVIKISATPTIGDAVTITAPPPVGSGGGSTVTIPADILDFTAALDAALN